MDSSKKDGKLPYEPPKIYELDVDMAQAMGASRCSAGASASTRSCRNGTRPASCTNGNLASGSTCRTGTTGTTSCRTGSST